MLEVARWNPLPGSDGLNRNRAARSVVREIEDAVDRVLNLTARAHEMSLPGPTPLGNTHSHTRN